MIVDRWVIYIYTVYIKLFLGNTFHTKDVQRLHLASESDRIRPFTPDASMFAFKLEMNGSVQ